jgi:hypothetical protein
MTELAKVREDMRMARGVRKKLYFLSPILTAAAFDLYERFRLRDVRVLARTLTGRGSIDRTEEYEIKTRQRISALGLKDLTVLDGPFKGMVYGDFAHGSPIMPKILGIYESELHSWVHDAIATNYDCVINVGCAEGYYAVGFAYAKPGIEVFAFDTATITDEFVGRLATLNNLQKNVHKAGLCSPSDLEAIAAQHARTLLFIDIEGFEDALLDIERAPSLRRCDIIVETHDGFNQGVTRRLIERLWPTHKFELISGLEDEDRTIPDIVQERIADPSFARMFVSEFRGMPELWVRFTARSAQPA